MPEGRKQSCSRPHHARALVREPRPCCCSDAAAFLGRAGRKELKAFYPDAIHALKQAHGLGGEEWDEIFQAMDKDGSPTAYVFQCLRCGKYGAYYDCD